MSWKLIQSVQKETDLRLVMPFGLALKPGDIVSVARDGTFTREGNCETLLRVPRGTLVASGDKTDLVRQYGSGTQVSFRATGQASNLFPDLPSAKAGVDVSLAAADAWVLAVIGRALVSLDGLARFRQPILTAYRNKIWRPDYALITSVAMAEKMTLLASSNRNSKVALDVEASVTASAALKTQLTSGVSLQRMTENVIHSISSEPSAAFCSAVRVKSSWFSDPEIRTLEAVAPLVHKLETARDDEFWENADPTLPPPSGPSA